MNAAPQWARWSDAADVPSPSARQITPSRESTTPEWPQIWFDRYIRSLDPLLYGNFSILSAAYLPFRKT
jgi:hypothetical protein